MSTGILTLNTVSSIGIEVVDYHSPRGNPTHKQIFRRNNVLPYLCCFCGQEVEPGELLVHHDDGNHSNNEVGNLKAAHSGCHTAHHTLGIKRSEEFKRLRAQLTREQHQAGVFDEHLRRLAEQRKGTKLSLETRAKISVKAKLRAADPSERRERSERAKRQWAARKAGDTKAIGR